MKMEEFEQRLRKQLRQETPGIDLEAGWLSLNNKLELELPNKLTQRSSGYLYTGLLIICLLLGYCISRSSLAEHNKSSIFKLGTVPIGVESHFAAGPPQLVEMPSSSFAQQDQGKAYAANVEPGSRSKHSFSGSIASQKKGTSPIFSQALVTVKEQTTSVTTPEESHILSRQNKHFNQLPTNLGKPLDYTYLLVRQREFLPASKSGIKVSNRKSIGIATNVGIPFGKYGAINSEFAALAHAYNSSLYYLESYGVKLTGSLAISSNFALRAGIEYNRLNQLLETERTNNIQRTVKDAVLAIKINPVTSDTTFIRGDVIESGTVYQSIRHYNRRSSVRIPIQFEYTKAAGTWRYGLSAGGSMTIMQRSKGRFIQDDGSVSGIVTRREKGWHALIIEPILEKEFYEKFVLDLRPYLLAPLQDDPNIELLQHKAIQVGLGLGLQYRW